MILDRLKQYIDLKGITIAAFERSIGMSNASFGKSLKQGRGIGSDKLEKILTVYPDLNPSWLLKGEGDPVLTESTEKRNKRIVTKNVPVVSPKPNVQKGGTTGELNIITLDTSGDEVIPIVDIAAAAGGGAYNPDYIESVDTVKLPAHLLHKGVHNCIRIKGQSMAPTLQDGGYVICRLLEPSEWGSIKDNYIYVVSTRSGETWIKRLRNRLYERGFIVCTSDNPDKASNPNFNIFEQEINTVWEVEWYLSAKMPNIHDTYYNRLQQMSDDIDDLKAAMNRILHKLQ